MSEESVRDVYATPEGKSKYKKVEIEHGTKNTNMAYHGYLIASSEFDWDKDTADIKYPYGMLEYLEPFNIYENANITIITSDSLPYTPGIHLAGSDFALLDESGIGLIVAPESNIHHYKMVKVTDITHELPPKPVITMSWKTEYLYMTLDNYTEKYVLKVLIDGVEQEKTENLEYIIRGEGKHVIYIEYVDDALLTMNSSTYSVYYKQKYHAFAPCILYDEATKHGWIYYHPSSFISRNENYYTMGGQTVSVSESKVDLGEITEPTKIVAWTKNNDDNVELYKNKTISASSRSIRVSTPDKDSAKDWKGTYDEYIRSGKLWNIEYFYTQEFKELYRGQEYKIIGDTTEITKVDREPHLTPEIIGLDDDGVVFSAFPHVKRYPRHQYYAYINREPYELGQSIDTNTIPIKKEIEFIVGCEYEYNGNRRRGDEVRVRTTLDTTFPSYPKLLDDVESIMTEPFKIDVVREKENDDRDIYYTARLNGKQWDNINSIRERERYIMEDGEYMLDIKATKNSNGTFRCRSSYFTINTFQHVPLKPLKSKILPLRIANNMTEGIEGELVVDSNSGNYGVVRNGVVASPTVTLSKYLLNLEEDTNDISKMYLSNRKRIDTLTERYAINSKNMGSIFNGENGELLKLSVLINEIKMLQTEINKMNDNIRNKNDEIHELSSRIDKISEKLDKIKSELKADKRAIYKILRQDILTVFSNARKAQRNSAELREIINNALVNEDFEKFKEIELNRYYDMKMRLEQKFNNGGDQ